MLYLIEYKIIIIKKICQRNQKKLSKTGRVRPIKKCFKKRKSKKKIKKNKIISIYE